jgi:uncharacterized protein (TIGR00290 family)
MLPRTAISWSGGKDSYLALHRLHAAYDVVAMVTMFSEDGARSRSHGLRPEILQAQADRLSIPLLAGRGSWATYEAGFRSVLASARSLGVSHVIFGDIMYDSNLEFPYRVCAAEGLTPLEPLFGESTADLYDEFVATGADARIVTVREDVLDASWLGRRLTLDLLPELAALGIDPCGEHGEYHTVVVNAPLFSSPLTVSFGDQARHGGCVALDLALSHRSVAQWHQLDRPIAPTREAPSHHRDRTIAPTTEASSHEPDHPVAPTRSPLAPTPVAPSHQHDRTIAPVPDASRR